MYIIKNTHALFIYCLGHILFTSITTQGMESSPRKESSPHVYVSAPSTPREKEKKTRARTLSTEPPVPSIPSTSESSEDKSKDKSVKRLSSPREALRKVRISPRVHKSLSQYNYDHSKENINQCHQHGNTYLIFATLEDKDDEVMKLLHAYESLNVNQQNEWGNTALHYSVMRRNMPITKLLLRDSRTQINITNNECNKPSDYLEEKSVKATEQQLLLLFQAAAIKKAIFNEIQPQCSVLLLYATLDDDVESVKQLLKNANLDVNYQDTSGNTALHYAMKFKYFDIALFLLRNTNTNVCIKNSDKNSPFECCTFNYKNEQEKKIYLQLKRREANQQKTDMPLLMQAVIERKINTIQKAFFPTTITTTTTKTDTPDINVQNNSGNTMLHYAALFHYSEILELLLRIPTLNINIKNNESFSPPFFCEKDAIETKKPLFHHFQLDKVVYEESFALVVDTKLTKENVLQAIKQRLQADHERQNAKYTDNNEFATEDRALPFDTALPNYATDEYINKMIESKLTISTEK